MSRSVPWRRTCSDAVSWRQDQASNTTIYILRNLGPTSFLLKEDGEDKNFKVFLGDPHRCTCATFMKEHDLCKHICWVLLKKFRVSRANPITWQLGLVEREINEVLKGIAAKENKVSNRARILAKKSQINGDDIQNENEEEPGALAQRPINQEDVCPICQEELLAKHLPVTYCKFGCGNNIHIKCMMVWAEHNRKSSGDNNITCPLCREDFGAFNKLLQEHQNTTIREPRSERSNQHFGITCRKCHTNPVVGKCYRCTSCSEFHLCQKCFVDGTHREHDFQFREKSNQRWRSAQRISGGIFPDTIVNSLQNRDLSDQDYDTLLQLDSSSSQQLSELTEEMVHFFPMERVRHHSVLLAPGRQCRICLRPYQESQHVRRLPCKHKFHKDCIDNWLLHQHPTCPIDGSVYTPEGIRQMKEAARLRQQEKKNIPVGSTNEVTTAGPSLELGGVSIAKLPNTNSPQHRRTGGSQRMRRNNGQHDVPETQALDFDVGLTVNGIVGYTHSASNDEDLIDSVLAANIFSSHPNSATYRMETNSNYESPSGSRRNSALSAASESDQSGVSRRSHMPPIDIPYDLSALGISRNSDTQGHAQNRRVSSDSGLNNRQGTLRIQGSDSLGSGSRNNSGGSRRHSGLIEVTPVPPSIPQPRSGGNLSLGSQASHPVVQIEPAPPLGAERKPPSGSQRPGRLRSLPLANPASRRTKNNGDGRPRSASRERGQLFVGHDPSSVQGFTSEYATRGTGASPGQSRRALRSEAAEDRYRWGGTHQLSGPENDMVLSGSTLRNAHI